MRGNLFKVSPEEVDGILKALDYLKNDKMLSALIVTTALVMCLYGPAFVLEHVNWKGLATLTSLIIIVSAIKRSGFLEYASSQVLRVSGGSKLKATILLLLMSASMSFFFMNDTTLLILVPITVLAIGMDGAVLGIITMAANIGSSMSAIGNPQNVVIWKQYNLNPLYFTFIMTLLNIPLILMLLAYSKYIISDEAIRIPREIKSRYNKTLFSMSVIMIATVTILSSYNMDYLALLTCLLIFLLYDKKIVLKVDMDIIVMFLLMFMTFDTIAVVVKQAMPGGLGPVSTYLLSQPLSLVVSNVPATLILIKVTKVWWSLAMGTNIAGIGFITGSLANLITIRLSKMELTEFHKVTLPFYIIALIYGLVIVLGLSWLRIPL